MPVSIGRRSALGGTVFPAGPTALGGETQSTRLATYWCNSVQPCGR